MKRRLRIRLRCGPKEVLVTFMNIHVQVHCEKQKVDLL